MLLFDAHLDLACLAVNRRDMLAPPAVCGGPWQPATITLPSLAEGNVRVALATIFTEVGGQDAESYPAGDFERAHAVGRAQLEVYETWRDAGHVAIDLRELMRRDPHVGEVRAGMGVASAVPFGLPQRLARASARAPLHIGILVENADPIRGPDELPWWKERGVVAVGLAWAKSSRYATGNAPGPRSDGGADAAHGLTDLGRDMVRAMDQLRIVHDVSHLSDRAFDDLLALTDRPVIASHSNCRSILKGDLGPEGRNHRLLRDDQIRAIAGRGGVIGLNLVRAFIPPRADNPGDPRPTIAEAVDHVERICELAGHRGCVGLGTDMDGGISGLELPAGIERPADLSLILDELRSRGWSEPEVEGFAWRNWSAFFERAIG
ncbi:MAG: membrane dipeptidase [Planctomycetota bacterium]|nr:membrane dipeptidase [Planctomycetota bacterium]